MVYFGSKTGYPPDVAELSLAARAVETFIPESRRPLRRPNDSNADGDATIASGTN